jgi:signal transduction histidine kinase
VIGKAVPVEALRGVMESAVPEDDVRQRGTQSVISVIAPLRGPSGRVEGAMEIVQLSSGLDARMQAAVADVLIRLGVVFVVTIGLTGLVLQRQVLRSLARLTEGIQRLGREEASAPLLVDRDDELGKVAQEFNQRADRLREADRRLRAETARALEATPAGGRVSISTEARRGDSGDGVALIVSDTGTGIAADVVPRIFESFFTTKPRGQGTGLGLAICRDIVKTHGGDLTVDSRPGEGSTFAIWMPAVDRSGGDEGALRRHA